MTVAQILRLLKKAPKRAIVAGEWEGQVIPVNFIEIVVEDGRFITPFVKLGVDSYDSNGMLRKPKTSSSAHGTWKE